MLPCRLIVDPPQDGAWNMAVDEALLEDAAEHGRGTLRFYQWSEPTLSLGYFQSYRQRQEHPASRNAPAVRRLSGGGALIHDRELTYSLCLPASHPLARETTTLYRAVHESAIKVLRNHGVNLAFHGDRAPPPAPEDAVDDQAEPFLCFARRTDMDIVSTSDSAVAAAKIVGSAQRRRRGAVLQHGAVLLSASPIAPELPGIEQIGGQSILPGRLSSEWGDALSAALALDLQSQTLDSEIYKTAQRMQAEKYNLRSWTERR